MQKQKLSKVLTVSYVRSIPTKNYYNWVTFLQIMIRKFVFLMPHTEQLKLRGPTK